MATISYVVGDATSPIGEGNKIIIHCCNNIGAWGAGFVLELSKKWMQPEIAYNIMKKRELGNVQYIRVENDIMVANMIGQNGVYAKNGKPPIDYEAIRKCLINVNDMALQTNSTIHSPRFGAGLAGGDWNVIETIIKEYIYFDVTVYDLH